MRSLSSKLVLAFLLTSLVGAVLAAVFVRQLVSVQFDAFVVGQQREFFINRVNDYYAARGSLIDINQWVLERTERHAPDLPDGGLPHPSRFALLFGLADPQGRVLIATKPYQVGELLPANILAAGTPITNNGTLIGVVITPDIKTIRDPDEERYLASTDAALGMAAGITALIALVLGILLARLITSPLRELSAATRRIAAGELGHQVRVRSRDELGQLATQFNQMSADLARAIQLRHQMTADIAHDLRTPLTVLSGYLESLRDQILKPTPERFATLYAEVQILQRLVDDLHTLSLADAGELTLQRHPCPPAQILAHVAETYRHAAEQAGITISDTVASNLPEVVVDDERLCRALGNLVSNAIRHTPAGGQIELRAEQDGDHLLLQVCDNGEGIPTEHLPNIFERLYRADQARQQAGGSGLGLAIVRSIIEAHGGTLGVESAPGAGSRFWVRLPITPASIPQRKD
ncbi:histidine kinase [Oscillochloris trichoides DG-6]|uniref:histidine kinase n=1 Tax=Oscillochloris trichoides DG-6 TaxID=765420 RepID=E1I9V1_9CHLR|nr:ATP-binding protein [Oscillochloris trichoides]EFO81953.1 histidine kinase [Oscillochloris trichoides DG-6]